MSVYALGDLTPDILLVEGPPEGDALLPLASEEGMQPPVALLIYRPDLLGKPRFPGDHYAPIQRTPEQTAEWARLLANAEVLLDVDRPSTTDFFTRAPHVRWIQSSSSGVGDWARRLGLLDSPVIVTNAAGLHATSLSEFALFAMLYFAKDWPRLSAWKMISKLWRKPAMATRRRKVQFALQ